MHPKVIKLSSIGPQASRRTFSESQLEADPALVAQGWELRFIADENRLREATELYTRIGFEVLTEPVRGSETSDDDCGPCQASAIKFHAIYVRRKAGNRPQA